MFGLCVQKEVFTILFFGKEMHEIGGFMLGQTITNWAPLEIYFDALFKLQPSSCWYLFIMDIIGSPVNKLENMV